MSPAPSSPELDAVIAFVNTYDELEDPKDRLTSITVLRHTLERRQLGHLADGLTQRHVQGARRLRETLRQVFVRTDDAERAAILNELLYGAQAQLALQEGRSGWRLATQSRRTGLGALTAAFAGALATVVAAGAGNRLGVCAAHPCRCVFVDATKARRQRYCCELCNDRVAAAAYRRRRR